jgi:hypothetical protein
MQSSPTIVVLGIEIHSWHNQIKKLCCVLQCRSVGGTRSASRAFQQVELHHYLVEPILETRNMHKRLAVQTLTTHLLRTAVHHCKDCRVSLMRNDQWRPRFRLQVSIGSVIQ